MIRYYDTTHVRKKYLILVLQFRARNGLVPACQRLLGGYLMDGWMDGCSDIPKVDAPHKKLMETPKWRGRFFVQQIIFSSLNCFIQNRFFHVCIEFIWYISNYVKFSIILYHILCTMPHLVQKYLVHNINLTFWRYILYSFMHTTTNCCCKTNCCCIYTGIIHSGVSNSHYCETHVIIIIIGKKQANDVFLQ